jgi:hypothetical protein
MQQRPASARIKDSAEEVFGELKVTTTTGFGTLWLAPRLPALYEKYPDLNIDLMLEERVLDLPMREADVAVRMKEPLCGPIPAAAFIRQRGSAARPSGRTGRRFSQAGVFRDRSALASLMILARGFQGFGLIGLAGPKRTDIWASLGTDHEYSDF